MLHGGEAEADQEAPHGLCYVAFGSGRAASDDRGKSKRPPDDGRFAEVGLAMAYFPQGVAPRVSSALRRFTSVFGMGTGGATAL